MRTAGIYLHGHEGDRDGDNNHDEGTQPPPSARLRIGPPTDARLGLFLGAPLVVVQG